MQIEANSGGKPGEYLIQKMNFFKAIPPCTVRFFLSDFLKFE